MMYPLAKKPGTGRRPGSAVHDDHVRRHFSADAPNTLWLTDITEHQTGEGKLYLCAIKDVYSGRIVGYSMDSRMRAPLAVAALRSAVARRGSTCAVVHTDRGSQGALKWSSQHLECGGVRERQREVQLYRGQIPSPVRLEEQCIGPSGRA